MDEGAQTYQTTLREQQGQGSAVQGILGGALATLGQRVSKPDPFLEGSKLEAARTASGGYLGSNPGAGTYQQLMAANDPSIGLLSGMTGQRATGDYSGFGQGNPAMGSLAGMTGGYRPQGNYSVGPNAGTAAMSGLASGYAPQGRYSEIGLNNPAYAALAAQANAGPGAGSAELGALGGGGFVGGGNDYLKAVAGGSYLNGNPYFEKMLDSTLDDVSTRVNNRFGATGVGFGRSTDHSGLLGRELATASNSMRGQAYEAERARMGEAAAILDNATRGDRGQQLQALGMLSDGSARDRAMGIDAATSLGGLYNQGQGIQLDAQRAIDAQGRDAFDARLSGAGAYSDAIARDAGLQLQSAQARDAAGQSGFNSGLQATGLLSDAYGRDQNIGLNAMQAGDQARQAEYEGRLRSMGLLSDAWSGQAGQRLAAAQAGDAQFDAERNRMVSTTNAAPSFANANYAGVEGLLGLAQGYLDAPWSTAEQYGEGVGGLLSPYSVTKGKTYGLGNAIGVMNDTANSAANAYTAGTSGGRVKR